MRQGWSGTRDDRQPMFAPSHKSVNAIRLSEGGGQIVTTATKVVLKPLEDFASWSVRSKLSRRPHRDWSSRTPPRRKPREGEVLAVGPGRFDLDAGAKRVPMDVKVGDVVLYSKYGGTEVKYHGEEYLVLSARDSTCHRSRSSRSELEPSPRARPRRVLAAPHRPGRPCGVWGGGASARPPSVPPANRAYVVRGSHGSKDAGVQRGGTALAGARREPSRGRRESDAGPAWAQRQVSRPRSGALRYHHQRWRRDAASRGRVELEDRYENLGATAARQGSSDQDQRRGR